MFGARMIQQQIKQWREEKFPVADIWDIYRKLLEEVGELAEAIARHRECIYGDEEIRYRKQLELEIGDVGVVLMGIAGEIGIDLIEAIKQSHKKNLEK